VTTTGSSGITRTEPEVKLPQGPPPKHLVIDDLVRGSGPPAEPGAAMTIEYIGDFYDGKQFTNSWERAKPFVFHLGAGSSFADPSWERGLRGMRLGGRRELIVPPAARGAPPGTPPSQTIVYVVDLIALHR
jgi:FKBP-type peptidyl-prolyl cis-trans isomerase